MPALLKGTCSRRTQKSKGFDSQRGDNGCFFACIKVLMLINLVVKTVEHKIKQIGNNSLCTFRFQKLNQMVVARRRKLDKDFSYNADFRLAE